eukprot:3420306-Pleurochrysis_carterae.AAC.1
MPASYLASRRRYIKAVPTLRHPRLGLKSTRSAARVEASASASASAMLIKVSALNLKSSIVAYEAGMPDAVREASILPQPARSALPAAQCAESSCGRLRCRSLAKITSSTVVIACTSCVPPQKCAELTTSAGRSATAAAARTKVSSDAKQSGVALA